METPYDALRKEMKPLGARLETGTVVAVTSPTVTVNIAGEVITDIPVAGSAPSAGDKVWLLRQGTTVVVIASSGGGGGGLPLGFGAGSWHPYESGKYYPGYPVYESSPLSSISAVAGGVVPYPMFLSRAVTISDIVSPNANSETDDLKWAIYDSDESGYPQNLLDSGEMTTPVTESVDIPLSADLTLAAGVYWQMFKWFSSAGSFRGDAQRDNQQQNWNHLGHSVPLDYTTGTLAAEQNAGVPWTIRYWASTYAAAWPDPFVAPGTWTVLNASYAPGVCAFKVA